MVGYETEEQQFEAIKKWFREKSNAISWIIIILAVVFFGARYWLHHRAVVKEEASEHYFSMLKSEEQKDFTSLKSKATRLINDYSKTSYAQMAALMLAKQAVDEKKLDEAAAHLQWSVDNGTDPDLKNISRVRLIKVLLAQDKLEAALALCENNQKNAWLTLREELRGDIYQKENNPEKALAAYKAAILAAPEDGMHGLMLPLKLNDLGMSNRAIEQFKDNSTQNKE